MTTLWEILSRFAGLFVWWTIVAPWEGAIRVRFGKHLSNLGPGIHFRIPYFDAIFRQSNRMRICVTQLQTLTTRDGKTITLCATVGYCVGDVGKLYNTLHDAEETVRNMIAGHVAKTVSSCDLADCDPDKIEIAVNAKLDLKKFGLDQASIKIVDFAIVKTYRLLQDQRWQSTDGLNTVMQSKAIGGLP